MKNMMLLALLSLAAISQASQRELNAQKEPNDVVSLKCAIQALNIDACKRFLQDKDFAYELLSQEDDGEGIESIAINTSCRRGNRYELLSDAYKTADLRRKCAAAATVVGLAGVVAQFSGSPLMPFSSSTLLMGGGITLFFQYQRDYEIFKSLVAESKVQMDKAQEIVKFIKLAKSNMLQDEESSATEDENDETDAAKTE